VWTFRLRKGVTWHNGKDFTSADVLYALKWMAKPGNGLALNIADVDLDKVSAQGPYTVVVPLKSPNLLFPYSLATASIVQRGAEDFTRPVGTGPFSFVSLDPGQQAVCTRNPAYWDPGKPYLDELVFLSRRTTSPGSTPCCRARPTSWPKSPSPRPSPSSSATSG
jgi:peptide/nickel transport system substrate-binding protein